MSELKFIETTDETIYTDILEELENGVGEPLYPGDERRIFGDTMAKVIVTVYNTVNDACRQKCSDMQGALFWTLWEKTET